MTARIDHQARAEDIRDLADFGASTSEAAARMGLTVDALERWSRQHARQDWSRLLKNERNRGFGAGLRRGRVLA